MKAGAVVAAVVAIAGLAWLYVALKPPPAPGVPAVAPPMSSRGAAPVANQYGRSAAREFDLAVANGQLASGGGALRVTQGSQVLIRVTSDRADELHLHGYDLEVPLRAGVPGVLAFTADKAGRFDLELHHSNIELGALEVQPR